MCIIVFNIIIKEEVLNMLVVSLQNDQYSNLARNFALQNELPFVLIKSSSELEEKVDRILY
ncbi:hypothetical protein ES707_15999 [subsurface metagenome]